jgi:hypothetical protein
MSTISPISRPNLVTPAVDAQADVFHLGADEARAAAPISAKELITGLGIKHPGTRADRASLAATLLYCCGADPFVSVTRYYGGLSGSGLGKAASANVEKLKQEWLRKGGTSAGFGQAIRAALAESLSHFDYGDTTFARSFEKISQKAAVEAKNTFPNAPEKARGDCMRRMRNAVWVKLNGFPLPPGNQDINNCRVALKSEYEGVGITGLVSKSRATKSKFGKLYEPSP